MEPTREALETQLNDFDPAARRAALEALADRAERGDIAFPEPRPAVNLHYHTFFSYNGYGYSPTAIAWRAKCDGLYMAGIVDFDVLDAVDEFLDAAQYLELRACAGLETRVFVPSFSTRQMNSPGEPGVAYYCGLGFTSGKVRDVALLAELKEIAQKRTLGIMERVNPYLKPVELDYTRDVIALTPNGNATERHLATAYDAKSRELIPEADARAAFWAKKLGGDAGSLERMFDDPPTFQGLIRSKTMKSGGVGYVKPEGPDFPTLERVSAFILECGAIPAYAFLDGTTDGEQCMNELLDAAEEHGAAALNIIPDRNWNLKNADDKKRKIAELYKVVELAEARDLPLCVGTEMNAYGQRFVDDFDAPELAPVVPAFLKGARILHAHTVLQTVRGMGYLSDWARSAFASVAEKNAFFDRLGGRLEGGCIRLPDGASPGDILGAL
ncbi:MAG TPA: hypothetical protein PLO37_25290 [Candidatus Hydrogenedentes bacterium]|nr:hypothetical protein [Candidatus Hydrogenedentota bacterium]HPG70173.1 hypothetical protein [Candidatus Hydrogenedentota bacterium]